MKDTELEKSFLLAEILGFMNVVSRLSEEGKLAHNEEGKLPDYIETNMKEYANRINALIPSLKNHQDEKTI